MIPRVVALHGFLGLPSDWDRISALYPGVWSSVDLWAWLRDAGPRSTAEDFAKYLAEFARGALLVGYSMGGRLAMGAFARAPESFAGAAFVSCRPGLADAEERLDRARADERWAARFESEEPWESVTRAWHQQTVFVGTQAPDRRERDFDRALLAAALRQWGVAGQRDWRAELAAAPRPSLWISGERDRKYDDLMAAVAVGPAQRHVSLVGAGHRAPWDQPEAFAETLHSFAVSKRVGRAGEI